MILYYLIIFFSKCTLILLINSCIIHTWSHLTRKSQITTGIQLSDFSNILAYNFQKLGKLYPQQLRPKNYNLTTLRVCLGSAYFVETEIFLLKVL